MIRIAISLLQFVAILAPVTLLAEGPLRIVATGGRIGTDTYTVSGSITAFRHRTPHVLCGPVDEMQVGFMNWRLNYTAENVSADDITIEYAWLERDATGQVVPLTFRGERNFIMPANSTQAYFPADPISSTVWTGSPPARDDLFWVHVKGRVVTNGVTYLGCPATWSGARFIVYDPVNDPGSYDTTGPVPTISGQIARIKGLPIVFTGRYSEPGYLSVIGIGDSILDGSGDSVSTLPAISGYGFFSRAAVEGSGTNAIALFNVTRHGTQSTRWVNPTRLQKFLRLANVIVEEYGTNDIGSNGTGDPEDIKERLESIWSRAREDGVQYVLRTLLLPRTSSTDSWATKANQTPNTGWGVGEKRDEMNTFFYDSLSSGKVDVVVNLLDPVADPTDDHYWMTNGSAKFYNADSTHLNSTGNELLAPVLRSALLALNVDTNLTTYDEWTNSVSWSGQDSSPYADPNGDGLSNLGAYALDLLPLQTVDDADLPFFEVDTESVDGPWLVYTYRRSVMVGDVSYKFLTSEDLLSSWISVFVNDEDVIEELVSPDPDGDGSAELVRLRMKLSPDLAEKYLALDIRI